jgi:hypothetical protein
MLYYQLTQHGDEFIHARRIEHDPASNKISVGAQTPLCRGSDATGVPGTHFVTVSTDSGIDLVNAANPRDRMTLIHQDGCYFGAAGVRKGEDGTWRYACEWSRGAPERGAGTQLHVGEVPPAIAARLNGSEPSPKAQASPAGQRPEI